MNVSSIAKVRIHPAIGVARVGNSDEWFIGPEVTEPTPKETGFYRDKQGRKRGIRYRRRVRGTRRIAEQAGCSRRQVLRTLKTPETEF